VGLPADGRIHDSRRSCEEEAEPVTVLVEKVERKREHESVDVRNIIYSDRRDQDHEMPQSERLKQKVRYEDFPSEMGDHEKISNEALILNTENAPLRDGRYLENEEKPKDKNVIIDLPKDEHHHHEEEERRLNTKEIEMQQIRQQKEQERKLKEAADNLELEKRKNRRVWAGGSFTKPEPASDREFHWTKKTDSKTNDFLTLMRKCICTVLANQGFLMREVFVNKGKQIAVVLTLPEINLQKTAAEMALVRPLEFGVADLISLEPVDSKGRPLRTNALLLDKDLFERHYLRGVSESKKKELQALRSDIISLIEKDCSMKKIVRLGGGVWAEYKIDIETGIFDHDEISVDQLKIYRDYLVYLALRISEIELLVKKIRTTVEVFYGPGSIPIRDNQSRRRLDKIDLERFANRELTIAMIDALHHCKGKLKTLWDHMGLEPVEYSRPFEGPNNHMKPSNRMFYDLVWKNTQIVVRRGENNQELHYSPFSKIERLKMTEYLVLNLLLRFTRLLT
jgi:hypothetical protein